MPQMPFFRSLLKALTALMVVASIHSFAWGKPAAPISCSKLYAGPDSATGIEYPKGMDQFFRNNGRQSQADVAYTTTRKMHDFELAFPNHFKKRIQSLKDGDIVLDAGCGDAFLADSLFSTPGIQAQYIGVTVALNKRQPHELKELEETGRFRLHVGRYFEDISNLEMTGGQKVSMITDFFGVMSYTSRIDLVLQKYLELLAPGGQIFIANQPRVLVDNVPFPRWIRSIPGIKVQDGIVGDRVPGVIIERDPNRILQIPELQLSFYEQGKPPVRYYKSTKQFLTGARDDQKN